MEPSSSDPGTPRQSQLRSVRFTTSTNMPSASQSNVNPSSESDPHLPYPRYTPEYVEYLRYINNDGFTAPVCSPLTPIDDERHETVTAQPGLRRENMERLQPIPVYLDGNPEENPHVQPDPLFTGDYTENDAHAQSQDPGKVDSTESDFDMAHGIETFINIDGRQYFSAKGMFADQKAEILHLRSARDYMITQMYYYKDLSQAGERSFEIIQKDLKQCKQQQAILNITNDSMSEMIMKGIREHGPRCSHDDYSKLQSVENDVNIARLERDAFERANTVLTLENSDLKSEAKALRKTIRELQAQLRFGPNEDAEEHFYDDSGFIGGVSRSPISEGGFGFSDMIGSWGDPPVDRKGKGKAVEGGSGNESSLFEVIYESGTSYNTNPNADVGMHSLDEILDSDGEFSPKTSVERSASPSPSREPEDDKEKGEPMELSPEDDRTINDQLADHNLSLQQLIGGPKPGILKVGFNPETSIRGGEYDHKKLPASTFKPISSDPLFQCSGSMRTCSRFGVSQEEIAAQKSSLGVFESKEERNEAFNAHTRAARGANKRGADEKMIPGFFQHGIAFVPGDKDANRYMRTILIEDLPEYVHLRDVLTRVRGGDVLSATLLNTISMTGFMSARVVFKTQAVAEDYATYTQEHGVVWPWQTGEGLRFGADVKLVPTPTFPVTAKNKHWLNPGSTRCLVVADLPKHVSIAHLENLLSRLSLLEIWLDEVNNLHMQYSSIEMAEASFHMLEIERLEVQCETDPCAGPLDELHLPVSPRPPMFPSHIKASCDETIDDMEGHERKPLPALTNQKVDIPSFSRGNIQGNSWADEVEEDQILSDSGSVSQAVNTSIPGPPPPMDVPPNSPVYSEIPEDYSLLELPASPIGSISLRAQPSADGGPIDLFPKEVYRNEPERTWGSLNPVVTPRLESDSLGQAQYGSGRERYNNLHNPDEVPGPDPFTDHPGIAGSRWVAQPPLIYETKERNPLPFDGKNEHSMFPTGGPSTSTPAFTVKNYASPQVDLSELIASRTGSLAPASSRGSRVMRSIDGVMAGDAIPPPVPDLFITVQGRVYDIVAATHAEGKSYSMTSSMISPKMVPAVLAENVENGKESELE